MLIKINIEVFLGPQFTSQILSHELVEITLFGVRVDLGL